MPKKPITPGQKAAKARDRERFAAKLASNEAEADRVHERLLRGDRPTRHGGEAFAFPTATKSARRSSPSSATARRQGSTATR